MSGVFEVQTKVATEVANALNVRLLAPEKSSLTAKLTGLHGYFADQGRNQTDIRHDNESGRVYFVRAEALSGIKPIHCRLMPE